MPYEEIVRTMPAEKRTPVRRAMYIHGVDMNQGRKFVVSSAHDEQVIDRTIEAFDRSLKDLQEEAVVSTLTPMQLSIRRARTLRGLLFEELSSVSGLVAAPVHSSRDAMKSMMTVGLVVGNKSVTR